MRARIQKEKKIILIYGLTEEKQAQLKTLCTPKNVECRFVKPTQVDLKIAQLFDDNHLPEAECETLDGKFAVLAGFGERPEEALTLINQVDDSVIKAVRTMHNGGWKFRDLSAAITEEYRVMHQNAENPNIETEKK